MQATVSNVNKWNEEIKPKPKKRGTKKIEEKKSEVCKVSGTKVERAKWMLKIF